MSAVDTIRDALYGNPPVTGFKPTRAGVLQAFTELQTQLNNLSLGTVSVVKDTRAHLNADLAHDADVIALVYADATPANNDLYVKVGASGSGSWTLIGAFAAVLSPYVTSCLAAVTLANHYANDSTNVDVSGGSVGDRGAKYWSIVAAAAAASVPTGAGTYIEGNGLPGYQVGTQGAFYYDLTGGYLYGPKTAIGWGVGILVSRSSTVSTRTRMDFSATANVAYMTTYATFGRSTASSDMLFSDPYNYALTNFAAGVPVMRPGKGLACFGRAQQLLLHPDAPVTETLTLAVGVHVVIGWGPGGSKINSAAGTAVGTGFGDQSGNAGTFQTLNITTGGTVIFTPSGGLTKANVQVHPDLASFTRPVPYISYQGIRDCDSHPATTTGKALFQTAAGTFIARVSDVAGSFSNASTLLGLNGASYLYTGNLTGMTIQDGVHALSISLGVDNLATGANIGFAWDATASQDIGGGSRLPSNFPYTLNNGASVTAVQFGAASPASYGVASLNGFLQWMEIDSVRFNVDQLYVSYSSFSLKTVLLNTGARLPHWEAIKARAAFQVGGSLKRVLIVGPSNVQGITTINESFINLTADLFAADGLPASKANWFGVKVAIVNGVATAYNPKLTFNGTTWALYGSGFGRAAANSGASGGSVVYVEPTSCNAITVYYRTQASGAGSFTVNVDGGAALGGSTSGAGTEGALQKVTFTGASLAAHTWNIVCTGSVVIVGAEMYNSNAPVIQFINGGASSYQASNQATADWLDMVGSLNPDVIIYYGGGNEALNSTVAGETTAQLQTRLDTMVTSIAAIFNAAPNADRIICTEGTLSTTDPSGNTPVATQDKAAAAIRAAMWDQLTKIGPIIDFTAGDKLAGNWAALNAAGYKADYAHNTLPYKNFQATTLHGVMTATN